jgi:methionyl-tRNA formyltransferase
MKIGFYVLGEKGYQSLARFTGEFGPNAVAFVMAARDSGVEKDWFAEIASHCGSYAIRFLERNKGAARLPDHDWSFAIGWRWMIESRENLIVFHDSLLPKYRGFAPLVNMLLNGEKSIGVTALLASDEYDRGDIAYQSAKAIEYPITIASAISAIIPLYADLVVKCGSDIQSQGKLICTPQDEASASYSVWRDEEDYFVDWTQDADAIRRFVDAVGSPYRGAAAYLGTNVVRIMAVEVVKDVAIENRRGSIGKVIFMQDRCPVIVCGVGLVKINDLRSDAGEIILGKVPFRSRFASKGSRL